MRSTRNAFLRLRFDAELKKRNLATTIRGDSVCCVTTSATAIADEVPIAGLDMTAIRASSI